MWESGAVKRHSHSGRGFGEREIFPAIYFAQFQSLRQMKPQRVRVLFLTCITTNLWVGDIVGQDTHYWSQHYGTRSTLLGGSVIGSLLDISSTYYNPGALALMADPEFVISGSIFGFRTLIFKNGAGQDLDLSQFQFKTAPDLLAGLLTYDRASRSRLAFSVLSRQKFHVRLSQRQIDTREAITSSPGEEPFGGEVVVRQDLDEDWGGLTWSYRLSDKSSIGLTQYIAVRAQLMRVQVISQALTQEDVATTIEFEEFDYDHWRTLWKVGAAFDFKPVSFGLSLTTPSLRLFGSGTATINRTVSGQDVNNDNVEDLEFIFNEQEKVKANYKSSWAVGMGLAYHFEKSAVHVSAEWFDAVSKFDVLETEPFEAQSSGEAYANQVTHELRSIVNFGIGVEHTYNSRLTGYASFSTDFSAAVPGTDSNLAVSNWDLYHLTGGSTFRIRRFEFTLGMGLIFGNGKNRQPVNLIDANESNELLGTRGEVESTYRSLLVIAGFSFYFGEGSK